jgi:plastocyanin
MRVGSSMRWLVGALAAALGCGSSMGGYGGSGSAAPPPVACTAANATATSSIEIAGMEFIPACAKVAAGTAVTFTNNDSIAHTVTSDAGQAETFDSGALAQGAKFTHTFASAETEAIHCSIHSTMHVTVIAQ